MKRHRWAVPSVLFLWLVSGASGAGADEWFERTETLSIPVSGLSAVSFKNFDFSEFEYRGSPDSNELTMTVTYRVLAENAETGNEILGRFAIRSEIEGEQANLVFDHPRQPRGNVLNLLRGRWEEWKAEVLVTGPVEIGLGFDANFSEITINRTSGRLSTDTDFSEILVTDHQGMLETDIDFGEVNIIGLNGWFRINGSFTEISADIDVLVSDSSLDIRFGKAQINFPPGTGAEFLVEDSFSGIGFETADRPRREHDDSNRRIWNDGGPTVELDARFGSITVTDRSHAEAEQAPRGRSGSVPPPPEPAFEAGIVQSVSIHGEEVLPEQEVLRMLGIQPGKSHTREDIERRVERLEEPDTMIQSADFWIDARGNLTIDIEERPLFSHDFEPTVSFSRVAGVGIGPGLTITSRFGPLNELHAGTEYHFANKQWTFAVSGEKRFFSRNVLAIGGMYGRRYESNMDWAVPSREAGTNAFLTGNELINLHQVLGGNVFISQSLGDVLTVSAGYFDEDFSSLIKHTNWSLFDHDAKEPNAALNPLSEGRFQGVRFSGDLHGETSMTREHLRIEVEHVTDSEITGMENYTRYLGIIRFGQRFWYGTSLITRLAGGYSADPLPDQRAFRLDGLNTLRGYDPGEIPAPPAGLNGFTYDGGGNRMALANIEYLAGLDDHFGVSFFGDAGGVWRDGETVRKSGIKGDVGIGVILDGWPEIADSVQDEDQETFRINWAIPVGPLSHRSHWTINFSQPF